MAFRALTVLAVTSLSPVAASRSLRAVRENATLVSERHPTFTSVETCEESYFALKEECDVGFGGASYTDSAGSASGGALGRQGGLVDDEDGGSNVITRTGTDTHGRSLYKPPEGETGVPSDITGWDYRGHGDDWEHLGECGAPGQSPVDLARYVDVQGQTKYLLWFDYFLDPHLKQTKQAHLLNDGHGVRYDVRSNGVDMGFVKIGDEEFTASEYIFHAPSEHSMDGAVFPLELQLYNKGKTHNGIVAVAILFREGKSNQFLAGLKDSTDGKAPRWSVKDGMGSSIVTGAHPGAFDLETVIPRGDVSKEKTFYNYEGSLTQPPCTTGVDWWVLSMPMTATRDEIRFIRRGIFSSASMRHGNARSSMPVGNRSIFVGLTGFQHASKTHVLPQWEHLDEVKRPRGYSSEDMPWGFHWTPDLAPGPAPGPSSSPASSPAPAKAL